MKSLRNNRRILSAILLTLVCFAVSAAPAAALDRGPSLDERSDTFFSRAILQVQTSVSSFVLKLGGFWNAAGAIIED